MMVYYVLQLVHQRGVHVGIGRDDGGLVSVASGEVLAGHDAHTGRFVGRFQQDDLAVVAGQIDVLHGLREERPQREGLVGGFLIQHDMQVGNGHFLAEGVQSAQVLIADGERGLINGDPIMQLMETPFHNVGNLEAVTEHSL